MSRNYKEYYRANYANVRRIQKEYFKRKYEKRKVWLEALKNRPCEDCGQKFPVVCMDFHHIHGKKKFDVGQGIYQKSVEAIMLEILKCIVICSNCHRIRTQEER